MPDRFVGRCAERAAFLDVLADPKPVAIFVHGAGGSGKSALLSTFAALARDARVDVLTALPDAPIAGPRTLILLDDRDDPASVAADLHRRWRAELADSIVVVASRTQLPANLRLAPDWPARVELIEIGPLSEAEIAEYLSDQPTAVGERVARLSMGNPLALRLLTDVAVNTPDQLPVASLDENMTLVRQLIEGIVEPVPSAAHRRAVQLTAQVGHTTEDVLSAVLDGDAHQLFEWLRRQPYVTEAENGVVPDELVRTLVDADLRWRDRLAYATLHRRASRHLITWIEAHAHVLDETLRGIAETLTLVRHRVKVPGEPTGEIARGVYFEDDLEREDYGSVMADHVRQSGAPRGPEQIAVTSIASLADLPAAIGTALYEAQQSSAITWEFVVMPPTDSDLVALFDLHSVATLGEREVLAHDWRRLSPAAWLRRVLDQPWDAPIPAPTGVERRVLADEQEFTKAVRTALRDLRSERRLATNPLIDSRVVQETLPDLEPAQRLRALIKAAAEALRTTDPALFRIIDLVYLRPSASQQTVAETMNLPFTTFRRWRNKAVGRVAAQLWQQELGLDEQ